MKKVICSACLLGINCRYNGKNKKNKKVISLSEKNILIPVCPEQLAGFSTPREPVEVKNKHPMTKDGRNLYQDFLRGAKEVLKIAKINQVEEAIMKQGSPSCGYGLVPEGSFSGKTKKGNGITTSLLLNNRIKVISEEDL